MSISGKNIAGSGTMSDNEVFEKLKGEVLAKSSKFMAVVERFTFEDFKSGYTKSALAEARLETATSYAYFLDFLLDRTKPWAKKE